MVRLFGIGTGRRETEPPPIGNPNEVDPQEYLARLSPVDRENVNRILGFVDALNTVNGPRYSVIAVGSTVRGVMDPGDIDLRILNSGEPNSDVRRKGIETLKVSLRTFFGNQGISFAEIDREQRPVKGFVGDREEIINFVDFNVDPRFQASPDAGLPLDIWIDKVEKMDTTEHLKVEDQQKMAFSLLLH